MFLDDGDGWEKDIRVPNRAGINKVGRAQCRSTLQKAEVWKVTRGG
jgi:hypothetical protein